MLLNADCRRKRAVAVALFFVAATVNPRLVLASDDAQLCDNSTNDPDQGIPACTRMINGAQTPNLELVFNNRGNAWFRKGVYSNAIEDYRAAIERNPNFVDAFRNRAFVLINQSDFDPAISDLNQAIRLDSKSSFAFYLRGFALYSKGDFERAIKDFDQAIVLKSDNYPAFIHRGDAWHRKRDFDRALKDFDQAIKLAPTNPTGLTERAQVWIDKGEFDRAIRDYDQAISLDPKDWRAYSGRGESFRLKHALDAAIASHNEAVRLSPKSPDAYINRALAWKDKGELDHAIEDYDEALLINPKDDRALSSRGEVLRLKGELDRSLSDLDKAVGLIPNSAMTLCRRGETFRARGELNRALDDFNAAIVVSSNAICGYTGRGLTLESKGVAQAAKDYEKAIGLVAQRDPDPVSGREAQETARQRLLAIQEAARNEREKQAQAELERARLEKEQSLARKVQEEEIARQARDEVARRAFAKEQAAKEQAAKQQAAKEQVAKATPKLEVAVAPPKPVIEQGKRVALVIGNSTYDNVPTLANPVRDADAVADAFRKVGFNSVQVEHNLPQAKLIRALRAFEETSATADWSVIYFAGHGLAMNGTNYLVPTDAKILADRDVQDEAVSLDRMLVATSSARKLRIVILDACRDDPFVIKMRRTIASRSVDRGLTAVEPDVGTLVAYSARDGQVALDGDGVHSPFVVALLNHLQTPNLEIGMFFRIVRDDVRAATDRKQEPFVYGSLPGEDFYFLAE